MGTRTRLGWRLAALVGVVALLSTACDGDGPEEEDDPDDPPDEVVEELEEEELGTDPDDYCEGAGSTVLTWAHEQEPPDLHLDDPDNSLSITSWIQQGIWEGAFGVATETLYVEELVESAGVEENDDGSFTYRYQLRDELTWSDGEPLTAEHVLETYELILDGVDLDAEEPDDGATLLHAGRADYLRITEDSLEVDSDTEFSYETEEFFAGWPSLFDRVYPTHVLSEDGEEANEQLAAFEADGEPLPSSGPFTFEEWDQRVAMTLGVNQDYHGRHPDNDEIVNNGPACVEGVEIRFVRDTEEQVNALTSGEADLVFTQPQVAFGERLVADEQLTVASEPGPAWEHWGFNRYTTHAGKPEVREAIAFAMDKAALVESLYEPIYGDLLPEEGLGNAYLMPNQPGYEDHTTELGYGSGDVDAAAELMDEADYERNDEGIWEHPDDGPASLRVGTTGGNQIRELQQRIIQQQLDEAGFEIVIDNVQGSDYFRARPFSDDHAECVTSLGDEGTCDLFDITQFAWVGDPWPGVQHIAFRGQGPNNPYGYANDEADDLMDDCESTVDPDERTECYNDLSEHVTTREVDEDGLLVIPLTTKPQFYAHSNETLARAARAPDANAAGPLAYGVDYLPR